MACIGIDVVRAKPRLHQFVGRVPFPDRPLSGTEHGDRLPALVLQRLLVLQLHHIERLFPGHRVKLALFVILPIGHAQQRLSQPINAVHDLG
ncbi:hypothetical protein D3C84_606690 [compost metagenome]